MSQSSNESVQYNAVVSRLRESVIAVPPLSRHGDLRVSRSENAKMIQYLKQGVRRVSIQAGNYPSKLAVLS